MTANRAIMQGDAKISIHMPHTWHDLACFHVVPLVLISIHMPHTWHDYHGVGLTHRQPYFNPHATYVA